MVIMVIRTKYLVGMRNVGMKTSKFLTCGMAAVDVNSQIAENGNSFTWAVAQEEVK